MGSGARGEGLTREVKEYGIPKLYNLREDPGERENMLFPNMWVPKAAIPLLIQYVKSLQREPPIAAGDPGSVQPPGG